MLLLLRQNYSDWMNALELHSHHAIAQWDVKQNCQLQNESKLINARDLTIFDRTEISVLDPENNWDDFLRFK